MRELGICNAPNPQKLERFTCLYHTQCTNFKGLLGKCVIGLKEMHVQGTTSKLA